MVNSMTGFASLSGEKDGTNWVWEIRSVNGRGLDIRTRFPEGFDALEKFVKSEVSAKCARGTVNVGLRLKQSEDASSPQLNLANLDAAIDAVKTVEDRAGEKGLSLAVTRGADLLSVRGVIEMAAIEATNDTDLINALKTDFTTVLTDFVAARGTEGKSLRVVLAGQIEEISEILTGCLGLVEKRTEKTQATFRANIDKIMQNSEGVDEGRIAQELAVLAVKSDIAEELDRLATHIDAAHGLLGKTGPIGRKFDFLTQEFNREANTLCSKSGYSDLTQLGLDLKTVIDQMREQVQNVE